MIPFQCDLCHFRNLKGSNPRANAEDFLLLRTIRRASLDAFWSREPSTVESNRREGMKIERVSEELGLSSILPMMGPFPVQDSQGMGIAVCTLKWSLDKGKYQSTLQYESVRKMHSAYSNIWHASKYTSTTSAMARDVRKTYVTSCPSYLLWFERFMEGMHKRMGGEVHQDKAITLNAVHKLVEILELEYMNSPNDVDKEKFVDMAVFILASFLTGLRGEETFKLVLGETREYLEETESHYKFKHVVLPLRGRFKGESGEGFHFVAVTTKSNSGLCIGPWVRRALILKEKRKIFRGFVFVDTKGKRALIKDSETKILDRIASVQSKYPELIGSAIDMHEEYGLSRSFRRDSHSEALNRGVSEATAERKNRWRKVERAGARTAKLKIRDHYTEVLVALNSFLQYSQAL